MRLERRFGFRLRPRPPYSFELTVHKPGGWPLFTPLEVYEEGVLWTALHIGGALTGLRLSSRGTVREPLILAEVFLAGRPSQRQRESIRSAVSLRLTTDDDLSGFYRMARRDPILSHTVRDLYGLHDTNPGQLFSEAAVAVLLQMAPLKRSEEMMECLIRAFGEEAEFDGRSIPGWPLPGRIAALGVEELNGACRLGYRAKFLRRIAAVLAEGGFPTIEELGAMPPDEAKRRLMELPGIGDYSADIINPHGGFPIDAWSADVFGKLFFGEEPAEGRGAIERIKAEGIRRWGGYAWMAFLYVVHDLEKLSERLGTSLRLS